MTLLQLQSTVYCLIVFTIPSLDFPDHFRWWRGALTILPTTVTTKGTENTTSLAARHATSRHVTSRHATPSQFLREDSAKYHFYKKSMPAYQNQRLLSATELWRNLRGLQSGRRMNSTCIYVKPELRKSHGSTALSRRKAS